MTGNNCLLSYFVSLSYLRKNGHFLRGRGLFIFLNNFSFFPFTNILVNEQEMVICSECSIIILIQFFILRLHLHVWKESGFIYLCRRGALQLTGENLKTFWDEFSHFKLDSFSILKYLPCLKLKTWPRFRPANLSMTNLVSWFQVLYTKTLVP